MEEVPRRTSLVPLAFPCFVLRLIGMETEGLLDYQGLAGDQFHCTVEPLPGHISGTKNQPKEESFGPDIPADIRPKTSFPKSKRSFPKSKRSVFFREVLKNLKFLKFPVGGSRSQGFRKYLTQMCKRSRLVLSFSVSLSLSLLNPAIRRHIERHASLVLGSWSAASIERGEKTPTPKISALLRKRPVLLRANFVLTKDRKRLTTDIFVVKYTGRGLVVKRPGVLSKVQMLNLVLGVGVFSLLPKACGTLCFSHSGHSQTLAEWPPRECRIRNID